MKDLFSYKPRTFLDISASQIVKTSEIVEESYVRDNVWCRKISWVTEKIIDNKVVETSIVSEPELFHIYK